MDPQTFSLSTVEMKVAETQAAIIEKYLLRRQQAVMKSGINMNSKLETKTKLLSSEVTPCCWIDCCKF